MLPQCGGCYCVPFNMFFNCSDAHDAAALLDSLRADVLIGLQIMSFDRKTFTPKLFGDFPTCKTSSREISLPSAAWVGIVVFDADKEEDELQLLEMVVLATGEVTLETTSSEVAAFRLLLPSSDPKPSAVVGCAAFEASDLFLSSLVPSPSSSKDIEVGCNSPALVPGVESKMDLIALMLDLWPVSKILSAGVC